MAADSEFVYEPIVASSIIRLIHLQPGNATDTIQLSITTESLDTNPIFEAISYTWGDSTDVRPIICQDASLSITCSLHSALVAFRLPDRPRTLWADAICINQTDAPEKGNQVLHMPRIYSQANHVLIWLGPDDHGLLDLKASVKQALEFLPPVTLDAAELAAQSQALLGDATESRKKGEPNFLDHDWRPIIEVFTRPWFRRKWIIQEVVLAKKATIYVGSIEIPWSDLASLSFKMESLGLIQLAASEQETRERKELEARADGSQKETIQRVALNQLVRSMHSATVISLMETYRPVATLFDCVVATAAFLCTNERDHIYALLSLPEQTPSLIPNYEASIAETFQQFAMADMLDNTSLKVLALAPHKLLFSREGKERLEMPSWVPDLRRIGEVDTLVLYTIREQLFWAGGKSKPTISFSDDEQILRCEGRNFDSVKSFAPLMIEMFRSEKPELWLPNMETLPADPSDSDNQKRFCLWLRNCYDLATQAFETLADDAELLRAFSRTMLCGMSGMRDCASSEMIDTVPAYLELCADIVAGRKPQISQAVAKFALAIEQSINGMALSRRFCVTEGGRFGQLPSEAKEGDRICVLIGAEVPYVLRPTGHGTYELIGECYIHGTMDGEVVDSSDFITEEIQIE